jgi:flagellar biosynthesis/type III secretory pathway chaperone
MSAHPAEGVLSELEVLLGDEREALVKLDRDAIEAFAARKLELDALLESAARERPLGASERAVLERVRQAALANQLLLAHARSCVQGVLTLLAPGNAPGYSAPGYPTAGHAGAGSTPPPIALNLRR